MKIFIKTASPTILTVNVFKEHSIKYLRTLIAGVIGCDNPDMLVLKYGVKFMKNDCILRDYNVHECETIQVYQRSRSSYYFLATQMNKLSL